MTIRTKEEGVPWEFAAARLFLDDIEEIVRIFQEAVQSQQTEGRSRVEDLKLKVAFSIGARECDDLQDLPKIARKTINFRIEVSRGRSVETWLDFNRYSTLWLSEGFSEEERRHTFRKLEPIFKRRKLHWRTLVYSNPFLVGLALTLPLVGMSTSVILLLSKQIPSIAAIAIFLPSLLLGVPVAMNIFRLNTVVFRHSSEPSPLAHYIRDKLIPVIVGAFIGIGGTILTLYLKHKFWP